MPAPHLDRHLFVCVNERPPGDPKGDCASKGGAELHARFKEALGARGLKGRMRANKAGCLDQCKHGCVVVVYPDQIWYGGVTVGDVDEIVQSHLEGGVPVERLRIK